MFLVAVEQAFCSQLANSDRTTSLANNTTADMQKESRSCDFRVLGFRVYLECSTEICRPVESHFSWESWHVTSPSLQSQIKPTRSLNPWHEGHHPCLHVPMIYHCRRLKVFQDDNVQNGDILCCGYCSKALNEWGFLEMISHLLNPWCGR